MKERPIIFSGPMVRAILDGRKTMTRRLAWRPASKRQCEPWDSPETLSVPTVWQKVKSGDRLWVRETIRRMPDYWHYTADKTAVPWPGRRDLAPLQREVLPSIFLPRAASRITLEVTGVKVERLQEISENDANAEGIYARVGVGDDPMCDVWTWARDAWRYGTPRAAFRALWESIHGAGAWDQNPWVVAISFVPHGDSRGEGDG